MLHRYSQINRWMLYIMVQVGVDHNGNCKDIDKRGFRAVCAEKFNVAHGRSDGAEVYDRVVEKVYKDIPLDIS